MAASRPLIAVLHGPNLNLLGTREPERYGRLSLADADRLCAEAADAVGCAIQCRQTNHEGELIDWVQDCRGRVGGIVINPGGYGHTSVALMDALLAVALPTVEVHVTNVHAREGFRHHSYVSRAATGVICGLGVAGYGLAVRALGERLVTEGLTAA